MPDEKEILVPGNSITRGVPVKAHKLGTTTEDYKKKKAEAQESVAEQLDERDQKTSEHYRYTYKQKAKAALVGATEEQDVAFVAEHDPEGNYSDEHKEVMRDLADDAASLKKYTAEITQIDADYAEIEDKDSDKAKKNRDEYNNAVEHKRKDDTAKKESEDAEAEEMKSVEAEIYTLTGILADVDEEIASYDRRINIYETQSNEIEIAIKSFADKYKDNDDYLTSVDEIISKDECKIPTAEEAHKEATAYYRGRRICDKIKEAIIEGKYKCGFTYLHETEIQALLKLGYYIKKKTDKNQKDRKTDLDDKFSYSVYWGYRNSKGNIA